MTDSITNLPDEFKTAIEIVSLCTSIPIYLVLSIKRVLLSGEVEPNTQNLLQKGRPFILRPFIRYWRSLWSQSSLVILTEVSMKNEEHDSEWYLQDRRTRKWMVQCAACNRWGYRHDAPPKFHGRAQLEKHIGEMK